jgi:iron complex outermembrane receptor protein
MDERLSGPLVTSGAAGSHPVGTAPTVVAANIVQTLPFARDWSIDAQFRWTAGKLADTTNTLRSPAVTSLNIGARHQFHVGDTRASLRIVATNVLNTRAWDVHTSGAISPVDRPTVWATLTLDLGGNE